MLSWGPYSGVSAEAAGCSEEEWLALSDTIRRYHELTHVICRRLYPEDVDPVRDELIADAVGLYAAYGYGRSPYAHLLLCGSQIFCCSAARISSSRKSGCASEISASARSQEDLPARLAAPYSVAI